MGNEEYGNGSQLTSWVNLPIKDEFILIEKMQNFLMNESGGRIKDRKITIKLKKYFLLLIGI